MPSQASGRTIYLNLRGSDAGGESVSLGAEKLAGHLKKQLDAKLLDLPEAIRNVYDADAIYSGPYLEKAPDLIVGYHEGYRAAWGAAVGRTSGPVLEQNDKAWNGDHCVDPPLVPGVLFVNRAMDANDPGLEDMGY